MPFPMPMLLITGLKPAEGVLHVSGGLGQENTKRLRTTQVDKVAQSLEIPSTREALALERTLVGRHDSYP